MQSQLSGANLRQSFSRACHPVHSFLTFHLSSVKKPYPTKASSGHRRPILPAYVQVLPTTERKQQVRRPALIPFLVLVRFTTFGQPAEGPGKVRVASVGTQGVG